MVSRSSRSLPEDLPKVTGTVPVPSKVAGTLRVPSARKPSHRKQAFSARVPDRRCRWRARLFGQREILVLQLMLVVLVPSLDAAESVWVNRPSKEVLEQTPGLIHETFESAAMMATVGYSIVLPPSYPCGLLAPRRRWQRIFKSVHFEFLARGLRIGAGPRSHPRLPERASFGLHGSP